MVVWGMTVVVVYKVNNGVGATTLAEEIARALLPRGHPVYLVDASVTYPALSLRYYPDDACGWLSEAWGRPACGCREAPPVRLEYSLVPGTDASRLYMGLCRAERGVLAELSSALSAYLAKRRGKSYVVVDLDLWAVARALREHTLIYIDDYRLARPTPQQEEAARMARIVVANRAAARPDLAHYSAHTKEDLRRVAKEIASLIPP